MAVTIDSLELQIKHDSADAVKGINSLVRALRRLKEAAGMGADLSTVAAGIRAIQRATQAKSATSGMAKGMKEVQKATQDATQACDAHVRAWERYRDVQSRIKGMTIQDTPSTDPEWAVLTRNTPPVNAGNVRGGLTPDIPDYIKNNDFQGFLDSLKSANQLAAEQREKMREIKREEREAAAEAERRAKVQAMNEYAYLKEQREAEKLRQKEEALAEKERERARIRAGKINESMAKESYKEQLAAAKESQAEYEKVIGAFSKAGAVALSVGKKILSAVTEPFKKAVEGYKRIVSMVKRMILRRIIMAAIRMITDGFKTGLEYLYQYSYAVNGLDAAKAYKGLDQLATTALYVKNSIAAAAMPIINVFIPVLQKIASWAVMAANAINQLVSALSGGDTYTKAKEAAVDYLDGVKDSASGANKAAKDLRATLLGFDEINRLDAPDSGSGSGGGGGSAKINYKDFFEPAKINSAIKDLADQIKQKIKNGDWNGIGKLLAQKLNAAIDKIDTKSIGKKITTKISNGAALVAGLLKETDFRKIGGKIADFLDGAIEGIRPRDFANVLTGIVTGLSDLLIGFIGNLSSNGTAGKLAAKLSIFLKTAIKGIKDYLKSTEWDEIGTQLFDILDEFIKNFDFSGISEDFWGCLGHAWVASSKLQAGFIAKGVSNWLSDIKKEVGSENSGAIIEEICGRVVDGLLWVFGPTMASRGAGLFFTYAVKPFLGSIVEGFGGEKAKKEYEDIVEKIINGIFEAIAWFGYALADFGAALLQRAFKLSDSEREKITNAVAEEIWINLRGAVGLLLGRNTELSNLGKQIVDNVFSKLIGGADGLHKSMSRVLGDFEGLYKYTANGKKSSQTLGSITGNYVTGYYTQMKSEGGYVSQGDLFIANEAGPELVGTVGGRTAVASNQEITGITNAVYAMGEREVAAIENLTRALNAKNMTAVITADSIVSGLARKNRRDGLSTVPVSM